MIYDLLAPIYDIVNADVDYVKWADFLEKNFSRYASCKPELVLDLGCGTGRMTLELASRGYDMTGVDSSPEMLDTARKIAAERGVSNVLWLMQDMRALDLYGTVDAAVSCLDTVNHLLTKKDLEKALSLVHLFLIPDGIFIFDINGKRKFRDLYGEQTYVFETSDRFCVWENDYDEKKKLCDFLITLFKEERNGKYTRYTEEGCERMYEVAEMKTVLEKCGFEVLGAYSDFNETPATDDDERIYFVARCIKKEG